MGTPINRWDAIPPEIIRGLTLCANGSSWKDAAAAIGVRTATLRRWWRDERAERFIEEIVRENIATSGNLLASAAPRLADELITIALDHNVKTYARVNAISECFKILRENVLEAEQRKEMLELRSKLESLEQPQVLDV